MFIEFNLKGIYYIIYENINNKFQTIHDKYVVFYLANYHVIII